MFAEINDQAGERPKEGRREATRTFKTADVLAWLSLADEWRKLSQSRVIDHAVFVNAATKHALRPMQHAES